MHVALRRGTGVASSHLVRFVGGRRFPRRPSRTFHLSIPNRLATSPETPDQTPQHNEFKLGAENSPVLPKDKQHDASQEPQARSDASQISSSGNPQREKSPNHGSAARRWMRNRRPKDLPPIAIPSWFFERNVRLRGDATPLTEGRLELVAKPERWPTDAEHVDPQTASEQRSGSSSDSGGPHEQVHPETERSLDDEAAHSSRVYRVNEAIMAEIIASISAGLSLSQGEGADTFASGKSHLKLHCPVDGSTYFLEKAVEEAAQQRQADVIRLDAQDLAEITSEYVREGPDAASNSLWSLGYDAQQTFPRHLSSGAEAEEQDEGENEADAAYEDDDPPPRHSKPQLTLTAFPVAAGTLGSIGDIIKKIRSAAQSRHGGQGSPPLLDEFTATDHIDLNSSSAPANGAFQWNDLKLNALLEGLMETNLAKQFEMMALPDSSVSGSDGFQDADIVQAPPHEGKASTEASRQSAIPQKTVLLIRGYKELDATQKGHLILEKIQNIAQKKRKEGHPFMIVGVTASADLTPEISREAFESLQTDGQQTPFRTLVVTPDEVGPAGGLFYRDAGRRIREINIRNIFDMARRLSLGTSRVAPADLAEFTRDLDFGTDKAKLSLILEEQVLMFDEVHRIVLTALGNSPAADADVLTKEPLQPEHIVAAMNLLDVADHAKTEWAKSEQQLQQGPEEVEQEQSQKSIMDARIRKIRKQCNQHEKVLLRGVVDPDNIRTTFKDVHAPAETIESLKTLTTLSLTRPEAFKYGVLATDKITGLLLYGPPGTGKTLLAKAVAKESGATVLEVSGSDIYDMYVGESEKNVRAIFSLARKLSPCVVFIDEADAIFASRGSGTSRNTHRELINQFLREWDGMTDTNAFIMVATNRPFDLDDAALRRLPRRLLVDLPSESDRESILRIHLKDEQLDPAVSIADLAARTPLYSGSDLKNMAVAAALAAVREENETAARHGTDSTDAYIFPDRRTLTVKHFDKAMEEITASVSDEMSSLGAIRKFDEKYGDKRGKKKRSSYGFSGGEGVKEDAAKVRS